MKAAGARRSLRMPEGFQPLQHPRLVDVPPAGPGWIHEIKFDGYRMQARVGDQVTLFTRNGHDWTHRFPELARDLWDLPGCILDAELCAVDEEGRPNFSMLQAAIRTRETSALVLFVFDILWGKGEDQRGQPLAHRKGVLEEVLGVSFSPRLRDVQALPGAGRPLLVSAGRLGLEGVVSKRISSLYCGGRDDSWRKAKARIEVLVEIGGYIQAPMRPFGGLLVGRREGGRLRYVGAVRSGFGDRDADLLGKLRALERSSPPFENGPPPGRGLKNVHWVRPELVAAVEIAEWTVAGKLRHPSFKGLRQDPRGTVKRPAEL